MSDSERSQDERATQHTFSETWTDPLAQAAAQQHRQYTDEARDPTFQPQRPREQTKKPRLNPPSPPPPPAMSDHPMDDSEYDVRTPEVKFSFAGNSQDLNVLWFLVENKAHLDTDVRDQPPAKVAYALSLFGGRALQWAVDAVTNDPSLRNDFDQFKQRANDAFAIPELAQKNKDQTDLMRLGCHPGKVADFSNQFAALCQRTGIEDESFRTLLFVSKLPVALKEKVLVLQGSSAYASIRDNALLIDSFHSVQPGTSTRKKKAKSKCAKCGRTNHATKDCYAKTTVG